EVRNHRLAGQEIEPLLPTRKATELLAQDHRTGAAARQYAAPLQYATDGVAGAAAGQRRVEIVRFAARQIDEVGGGDGSGVFLIVSRGAIDDGNGSGFRAKPRKVIHTELRPVVD